MNPGQPFRIRWTNGAADDLKEILDYMEKDSPQAADAFGERLMRHIEKLARFPFTGAPSHVHSSVRESVFEKRVVYYRIEKSEIIIKAIQHGAQQFKRGWLRRRQ